MSDDTTPPHDDADAEAAENAAEAETQERDESTITALQDEIVALRDQALRALAEADNARKRAEKDVADARAYSVTGFARDLLSVSDNLARALAAVPPEARESMGEVAKNLLAGVEITEKELQAALARNGVTPIAAEPGAPFDPNLHQAAAQIPSPHPAGAIVEVIQAGWSISGRVLRAPMVAVSSGPPAARSEAETSGAPGAEPGANVDTKA